MKRTILIIGANSALAKEVILILVQEHTVITAGRNNCDIYCDVAEGVMVPAGVDIIVNFAAAFGGVGDEEIREAEKTNTQGILNVCIAAKKAAVKHVINISSIFALLDQSSPFYSIYAVTKKHADELAQFYCKLNKIPLTILRPSQIYGDSDSFKQHQPFFYELIDKAQAGKDMSIFGNNDARRNYIHASDLSEIIRHVIKKQVEGTYVCTYPDDVTYSQIAFSAQETFGKGGKVIFDKNKPDTPDNIFTKDLIIYEKLSYTPQISIETGIKRIKEYRERH